MIHYSINPLSNGYRLTIWEPAPLTEDRAQPFHFKLNITLSSPLEAMRILNLIPGQKAIGFISTNRASDECSLPVS